MFSLNDGFTETADKPVLKRHRPAIAVNFSANAWNSAHLLDLVGPYAYTLNLPQIGECKPGHLMTNPMAEQLMGCRSSSSNLPQTPTDMEYAMHEDGMYYHSPDSAPQQGHAIGFFLKQAQRNHPAEILYLRRDSNGLWSYREITEKGGCRRPYLPRQYDFSGKPICNPQKADLGKFTQCLGFASIPYEGVLYYRRIVLPEEDMRPFHRSVPAEVKLAR